MRLPPLWITGAFAAGVEVARSRPEPFWLWILAAVVAMLRG